MCILPTSDQQCLFLRKFFLFLLFYSKVIFYSFVIQKPNGSLYYDLNVQWGIADFVLLLRLWLEIYVDPNYESQVKRNKLKTLLVKSIHTGWPNSKLPLSKADNSETKHFWPHVGKAKMRLRGGSFFEKL